MKRHFHRGHVKWIVSARHIWDRAITLSQKEMICVVLDVWFHRSLQGVVNLISFFTCNICCFITEFNKAYCMPYPYILRVTWLRHAPFLVIFLPRPLGYPKTKLCTKFEVPSWSSFEDMFNRMPKNLGTTWTATPLWGKLFAHPVGIPYAN